MYYTGSMKKREVYLVSLVMGLGVVGIITLGIMGAISDVKAGCSSLQCSDLSVVEAVLPAPEVSGGIRGELGIDKNVNEATIDRYLGRGDAVYRDMRMLVDEANYEAIGGDSYLSGFVEGFEVVPLPKIVNTSLPEAVGTGYTGPTLFTLKDGKYVANYAESMEILEYYFPKDKVIFLMCGGGGYAGMMKDLLVALGWDETKIYNVGGYWYYDGEYNVQVKRTEGGKTVYDFWKVPYHDIDFSGLSVAKAESAAPEHAEGLVEITAEEFQQMVRAKKSFVAIAHMTICSAEYPLTTVAKQLAREENMKIYALPEEEFKKTGLAAEIKYLPTAVIYKNGELVKYLDAGADEDMKYYQSKEGLAEWINAEK